MQPLVVFFATLSKGERKRVAGHDLRQKFASRYMMKGGDLYELAKIPGHANIKMSERYAKLGKTHIAST